MASQTEDRLIKSAQKPHGCSWCWSLIEVGNPYITYRFFDGGDVSTVKMHPECRQALDIVIQKERDTVYFTPGDNQRGHYCGGETNCDCLEHTKQIVIEALSEPLSVPHEPCKTNNQ